MMTPFEECKATFEVVERDGTDAQLGRAVRLMSRRDLVDTDLLVKLKEIETEMVGHLPMMSLPAQALLRNAFCASPPVAIFALILIAIFS